jgi:hypothetical protein
MRDLNRLTDKLDTEYNEIMDRETEDHIDLSNCKDTAHLDGPDDCNACEHVDFCFPGDYFTETVESDGISGDDVNRRLRESRLGYKAPSKDWEQAGVVVHCIYKDQVPTKSHESIIMWMGVGLRAPVGFVACEKVMADDHFELEPGEEMADDEFAVCNECGSYLEDSGFCDECKVQDNEPEDICDTCTTQCSGCDVTGNTGNCDACEDNHCNICTDGNMHQDAEDICVKKHVESDMPPELPNKGDDQSFVTIQHDLQHLECQKLRLENAWADVSARCTYRTQDDCALAFGDPCLFDGCKRL